MSFPTDTDERVRVLTIADTLRKHPKILADVLLELGVESVTPALADCIRQYALFCEHPDCKTRKILAVSVPTQTHFDGMEATYELCPLEYTSEIEESRKQWELSQLQR